MSDQAADKVYVCSRHLIIQAEPGDCPKCGRTLIECTPGSEDDPNRKPLIDQEGRVLTRAPIWWLRKTVTRLVDYIDRA